MKIVFLDEDTVVLNDDVDLGGVKALGEYKAHELAPTDDPLPYCRDAEIIIVNKVRITRERIEKLPKLKLICEAATGYDNVDIEAAREHGIHVTNVAGYAKTAVVQHVFAMILSFATKIYSYYKDVLAGEWQKSKVFDLLRYETFELVGRTLGIIGFGSIGRGIANIAESFGMKVIVHDVVDNVKRVFGPVNARPAFRIVGNQVVVSRDIVGPGGGVVVVPLISPQEQAQILWFREQNEKGMPPEQFADLVFKGIKQNTFYIISHPESMEGVRRRMEDIAQQRNPTPPER